MKNRLINEIQTSMLGFLNEEQMKRLKNTLENCLYNINISNSKEEYEVNSESSNKIINRFLDAKKIEGCSDKTIVYYKNTIEGLIKRISKSLIEITTEDLRMFLAEYHKERNISKVTLDNVRRIFSSFFAWLEDEDYIIKSPVRRIHKVKADKIIKEAFTDEQIELLRDCCDNSRDLAMLDLLNSTGMRVGELVKLNRNEINFNERQCIVFGKGSSEREVYFDAKAKIHLLNYLDSRKDKNQALFIGIKSPHKRLTIGGVQYILRKLGKKSKVKNVHPHRFRRTLATSAINKGMPIEQVQKLLGHMKIDTTMHYAIVNQNNVKISHRRYIS